MLVRTAEILECYEKLTKINREIDEMTYNAMINGLMKSKQFDAAYLICQEMMAQVKDLN